MKKVYETPDLIDFEEPKQELVAELYKIMRKKNAHPKKMFIVGKKTYFLVYQNMISIGVSTENFDIINPRYLKRGNILDSFSKIELIVNEILEAKVLGEDGNKQEFLDITGKIDLSQKIHLLKDWNLICPETFGMLHKIRKVRNVLAHSWYIKNAIYETNKTLETNFSQFKSDIKLIWKRLINVYDFLKPQNKEIEKILSEIKRI